jgi:hypothetical protein
MTDIQFGFEIPADELNKARRDSYVNDLNQALDLVSGHFESAWIIEMGITKFIVGCTGFPDLTTLKLLVQEVVPAFKA